MIIPEQQNLFPSDEGRFTEPTSTKLVRVTAKNGYSKKSYEVDVPEQIEKRIKEITDAGGTVVANLNPKYKGTRYYTEQATLLYVGEYITTQGVCGKLKMHSSRYYVWECKGEERAFKPERPARPPAPRLSPAQAAGIYPIDPETAIELLRLFRFIPPGRGQTVILPSGAHLDRASQRHAVPVWTLCGTETAIAATWEQTGIPVPPPALARNQYPYAVVSVVTREAGRMIYLRTRDRKVAERFARRCNAGRTTIVTVEMGVFDRGQEWVLPTRVPAAANVPA